MNGKVLLTGASGQLGRELRRSVPEQVELMAADSRMLDITRPGEVQAAMDGFHPQLIINAAAYTQVDKAESERKRAFAVNAEGVANLARAAPAAARIIHVSTDFVFDGTKGAPYLPDDPPHPLNAYGESKLAGERVLQEVRAGTALIIRTAWLYSPHPPNFVRTMLRLMDERESLSVVADQRGTPTSAAGLAQAIWRFAALPQAQGTHHWTDQGETTWYGFAREIQEQALRMGLLRKRIPLKAITTAEYLTPARRPAYSVLDKTSSCELLRFEAPPWQDALEDVLSRIKNS